MLHAQGLRGNHRKSGAAKVLLCPAFPEKGRQCLSAVIAWNVGEMVSAPITGVPFVQVLDLSPL